MHNEIGGYLDFSANAPSSKLRKGIYLNSGRHCLELILHTKNIKNLYLPVYGCHSLYEICTKNNVNVQFYTIDGNFMPCINNNGKDIDILYINYYGIFTNKCLELSQIYPNIIFDFSQAWYSQPILHHNTFYSPRKFFALPDGGVLVPDNDIECNLEDDISYKHIIPLFKRIDCGATSSYELILESRDKIKNDTLKYMSKSTLTMLSKVNFSWAKRKRKKNFLYLHNLLEKYNKLNFFYDENDIPLFYPFLIYDDTLRSKLINKKIFVATYWPGIEKNDYSGEVEKSLYKYLHPIPVDQRYGKKEMDYIVKQIFDVIT